MIGFEDPRVGGQEKRGGNGATFALRSFEAAIEDLSPGAICTSLPVARGMELGP